MEHAREKYEVSERHACRLLRRRKKTQHCETIRRIDLDALARSIITLASQNRRYSRRRVKALLRMTGRA